MRYRDLKAERDAAIARAVEAERLSMKSEFERLEQEFAEERARLHAQISEDTQASYRRGIREGRRRLANDVRALLNGQFLDDIEKLTEG